MGIMQKKSQKVNDRLIFLKVLCYYRYVYVGSQGDSGGPLFVGNQKDGFIQVGITSYGDADNCAFVGAGVFARVSRFFDWINIQTGGLLE